MLEGKQIFSPISHTHPIALVRDLPKDWDYWKKFDEAYLNVSRALYVLTIDGWEKSKGVQGEIEIMKRLQRPIHYGLWGQDTTI